MNKKKLFIIVSIFAAIGLAVMLFMLPKPRTNNSAKHETSTETSSSKESSKKNDNKKNQTSKKDDKKKDDTGKKEDKKEDTSTTSSETSVAPTTEITNTEPQNNNTGSSVTNTPTTNTTPAAPAPEPIYQTIHHEEVGHWETQVVQEAWDEPVYERKIIGNNTGTIYNSVSEWGDNANGDEGYHVGDVQVGTRHHDAVTQQVWIVDQYAWDETVIVGYR
ncbi:hypothetical protein [Solobacterium moorei]|uniref:hypothetical protein n=1 Tax=Solobacterium moorei TaxID=102148 RepID=UPI000425D932|nr:hypothetical protein [Solobacterium moorei]BET22162.1 hypothetical protein RGT18_17500 [Solobacterium moorei]